MMNATLSFFVPGIAKTSGSKRAFMRPGMRFPVIVDDCKESKNWKSQVALFASQALPPEFTLMTGPLAVEFTFYRARPNGHSGKKGLNKKGLETPHPITKPDALKLARAVEDALTGIVYSDDAQIVTETLRKRWGQPGVRIEIGAETSDGALLNPALQMAEFLEAVK